VSSSVISHERVDWPARAGWVATRAGAGGRRPDQRPAGGEVDTVVCATEFAQAEFDRIGAAVQRVPFGVDLATFTQLSIDSSSGYGRGSTVPAARLRSSRCRGGRR
jgi:hypothetical protein